MALNDDPGRRFENVFTDQLRQFDTEILEFREVYDALPPEQRAKLRQWVERAKALCQEAYELGHWPIHVELRVENEVVNDEGEPVHVGVGVLSPHTMLEAIDAWEKGQPYSPPGIP